MQSINWHTDSANLANCYGTQLNMNKGKITSYNFSLTAYDNGDQNNGKFLGSYI